MCSTLNTKNKETNIKMKKLLFRIVGVLGALGAPLLIGSVAHAAPITWSGGGTPAVDTPNKTITYNVNDTANWVGGVAPIAGDSMIFQANLAQVDPGGTLVDDSSWKYVVNNNLAADTNIVGITFSGDAGAAPCLDNGAVNDRYSLTGNAISLSGNIDNTYTGACASEGLSSISTALTLTANVYIEANIGGYVGAISTSPSINQNAFSLDICSTTGSNASWNANINGSFNGTGDLNFNCAYNYFSSGGNKHAGRIGVNSDLNSNGLAVFSDLTLSNGASLTINAGTTDLVVDTNITIEGTEEAYGSGGSGAGGSCTTQTITYSNTNTVAYTSYPRIIFNASKYEGTYPNDYVTLKTITLSGDLTFSSDLSTAINSNVTISGDINAAGKTISARQGGIGAINITSSANNSASTGKVTASFNTVELTGSSALATNDPCYSSHAAYSGSNMILKGGSIEIFTVESYGKFSGTGTITGPLTVKINGVYGPGYSPGCINSGNLTIAGTYEVELANLTPCTKYDQTKVTGTVNLTGGTLSVIRFDNMVPRLNDSFIIIDNDGSDAVTGTFTGMTQGATFVAGGITYSISYTGGTGNDVVLVVTAVDSSLGAPNTGAYVIKSGIILPILAITASMAIIGMNFASTKKAVVKKK